MPVPENLTNKLNKAVKNGVSSIIKDTGLGTEGGVEFVENKKVFNYDEYNTWQIKVRDAIRKEYPDVSDATLNLEIGRIVEKNSFLRKSLDMHNRTVDQIQKLTALSDNLDLERQKLLRNKTDKWQDNPVQYISDYISTSTGMKSILERLGSGEDSSEKDDFIKTVKNIQKTSNKIYDKLKSIYPEYNDLQLMQAAERTFSRLEIKSPTTWGNKAWFSSPSDEEIMRAAKGEDSDDSSGNETIVSRLETQLKTAQEKFRNISPRNVNQRKEYSTKIADIKEKILSHR